jgi:hypothetical protein
MGRINTARIVAAMANKKVIRRDINQHTVSDAMDGQVLPSVSNQAVSATRFHAKPLPTTAGDFTHATKQAFA